jgi:hypothetical protein
MLARYSILHELGRGATGAVYAARVRTTGAVVALKRLDPALFDASDRRSTERILKQVRAAMHLEHRNIVHVEEAGEAGGTVYVAMEMLDGATLRKLLDVGPLAIARAIQITHDIACGLAHAHLQAVVHARLKPSNILVLPCGLVKITDFGIGQLGHAAPLSGAQEGCLRYLSPEQLRGEPIDHRCDLYSLGVVLYEMLAQRAPFEGRAQKEITDNILRGAPRPPSELNPHVPRALDKIVLSLLAAQPADRMAGAPLLLRELQRLGEALGLDLGANAAGEEPNANAVNDEPAADAQPARAEPVLRMPGRREPHDREPRFHVRPEPSAAEALEPRDRVIDREVFDEHRALMLRESAQRPSRLRFGMVAALGLALAVLCVELAGFTKLTDLPRLAELARLIGFPEGVAAIDSMPSRKEPAIAATPVQQAPATEAVAVASASAPPPPAPATEETNEPLTAPDAARASPPLEVGAAQAEEAPSGAPSAPDATQPTPPATAMIHASTQAAQQRRDDRARLIVSVSPRGELYIDGKHHGTTPPITTFDLTPGMHRIEVRNGSRSPYLTYMTVQAGEVRRIRYDFDARPIRPPG